MAGTPVTLTLYNPETNEAIKTYSRGFIPWKLVKRSVQLMKTLDAENLTEADVDALGSLVCEVFGNQFTLEQLNDGADVSEMMTCVSAIMGKLQGSSLNPTKPG